MQSIQKNAFNFVQVQDHNKSIVYHERQLSVAKEIKDLTLESDALHGLGYSYGRVGNYEKSMECLEQGLLGLSELGNIRDQGRVYSVIHGRYLH